MAVNQTRADVWCNVKASVITADLYCLEAVFVHLPLSHGISESGAPRDSSDLCPCPASALNSNQQERITQPDGADDTTERDSNTAPPRRLIHSAIL
ncbi:hypothetical protein WMY93_017016 [Mugilogobius chulae]|uniref:Uncharacterized protein n=1 Tax=Mugilogobius chulae TaxID=88201 RepID=A0AAW0NRB6_9GOBI